MKEKCSFFPSYFINIGYSAIISVILFFMTQTLGVAAFGNLVKGFVGKMILVDIIFLVALAFRFMMTGFRDRERGKATVAQFLIGSFAWLILIGYEALDAFLHRFLMPATGISHLALALSGVEALTEDNITEVLQTSFPAKFLLSAVIHVVCFTAFSYLFYILGIKYRERESRKIQAGEEIFIPTRAHDYFVAMFIPLVHYVTFFPWLFHYCVRSERKFSHCIPKILLFAVVHIAFRMIRVGVYKVNQGDVLNLLLYITLSYIFGLFMSFLIYKDEKHYQKVSERE